MQYRKKPVVIEATQWRSGKFDGNAPDWVETAALDGSIYRKGGNLVIKTLEGDMRVEDGDWIIRGVAGELYPCKPDIFDKTYEVVE